MTARDDAIQAMASAIARSPNTPSVSLATFALDALTPDLLLAVALERDVITERSALTDNNTPRKHHRFFTRTEAL